MRSSRCGPHTMRLFASCSSAWCAARRTLDHRLLAPSPIVPLSTVSWSSIVARSSAACVVLPLSRYHRSLYSAASSAAVDLLPLALPPIALSPVAPPSVSRSTLSLAPAAALTATLSLALLPPALPYRAAPGFSWYIIIILVYTVFTFTVWLYPKLRVPQTFGRQYHAL